MRDEVSEHMAWDPRPFLHTESFQIPQISRFDTCGLSSSTHPTYFLWGLGRRTLMARAKTLILWSVNHFCADLVCFGILSCWKVKWPILMFTFNFCWYLMSMYHDKLSRAFGEKKQPHNIKDPPPYFSVGMRCNIDRLLSLIPLWQKMSAHCAVAHTKLWWQAVALSVSNESRGDCNVCMQMWRDMWVLSFSWVDVKISTV